MVSEALDGLTDEQLADLELQESGLVSGQNGGAIASTPFARRDEPQPEPAALSDYELNKLEEENYRRVDYVMTPQEFDQYWDRREKEDNEVGRFLDGLGQGAAGLIGMVPEAGRELRDAAVGMVTDPVNQVQRNVQTGAEIVRKAGINLVQLYDWVGGKVNDLATSSRRAEVINAGIMDRLIADGKVTGDRERDMQIYQAALAEARKSGAYTPTAEQAREDRQTAYQRYVREKSLERDYAAVSQFKTGESQMSSPTTAETYQITDEKPMETVSQIGAMAIDPVNLIPMGAGALSKARVLRRIAVLSEKPLQGVERAASGLADVAERIETGLSTRIQDITGLTQKQQAALGAGVAGTAVYVDSATEGQGGLTKAVMMVGGVLPALHYGGGLLRKVGSAAGGASTIVREAGVGGLGVARAEAAAGLASNAAIPERYRKFFTGYVDGTDSTLKRVAQNSDNPEALRRVSRFADRMGATQVARVADDAVSGAVTAGIVGTPFAALQPDAERAGEVMGGILALGAASGVAGGFARRRSLEIADADIARMFADVQASGGNVEAFSRLPHQTLDRLSVMQGVLAGKVDFIPLSGDEYRMNADIAQNAGETTAGVFVDKDTNNRARVFINLDAKTKTESIAPHEIGHAILTSDILDGQPRADLRNLVNQQYGPEGVVARGREYIGRLIDGDARAKTTGEMPTVLTEAEMAAVDGGKTMNDVVADRTKNPAERERLINERFEEFSQRSIDKGQDPLDWARDEIIAETFASEAPAIDFRAIRRDGTFPRIAESMLSAGGRVLEMFGANLSSTGRLLDNPSVLFRDNPLFQDRIMQKRVREYVRSYDQFLAGLEEAGSAAPKGVELARSNNPADLGRSTHVKLRDEGRGVLENDFLFQKPDGTYSFKPQKLINQTEASRAAQIKTLYDARKFVPVNSTEFGKRKVNGRETIGGPVLPPHFDLFTHFPKHVREFARAMEQGRAEGGSWDIDYNAIGTGSSGRYRITNMGAVRAIQRETVPFGWQVTKQNHLLAASLDLNAFRASATKAINRGELGVFNNDMRQVEADLKTYLGNHRNGLPGEAGIGQAKRDMLNGLIGTGTAVQRTANPLYYELNPKGSIRTWRVDRLNDAKPTGRDGYFFDYDKINNNRMPQALPREAMAMPDVPANLTTDQILRELEENQGYLGLSTLGMREGRPVKGGAQQTRELLKRNTALNEELRRRGGPQKESDVERVLRQRGQAMPDSDTPDAPRRYVSMENFIKEAGEDLDVGLKDLQDGKELPEGWFVHGRNPDKNFGEAGVVMATKDINVAEQYAGSKGDVYAVFGEDLESLTADRVEIIFNDLIESHKNDELSPDLDEIIKSSSKDEIAKNIVPENLVHDGGLWDNSEFTVWYWNKYESPGVIIRDDQAVFLDGENTRRLNLTKGDVIPSNNFKNTHSEFSARARGQAMPDGSQPMRGQAMADVGSAEDNPPRRLIDMPQSALKVLHADSAELPKPSKKLTNATVALTLADVAERHNGGIITSSNITPEQKSDLMILGADEAEAALKASGKNAGNWYSVAIEAALGIAGVIYRELSDVVAARSHAVLAKEADPVKAGQFALRLPLAITSQNMTVKLNTRASNEQFNIFLKTGKFDPSIAYGEKAKSISGNLDLANVMIDELGSVLALEDFVSRQFTVRELEAEASKIAGRSIKIAGRKDDIVNGAAIFGPKIGQGFLQNLMGKFDPVTIDLWMRRTWGRWTGDVVGDGVTAQRLARLIDQSRKAGRKLPDSIKRLRTTMRSMGETKTGKAKKPELTMSEDVEARLEADTAFRKEVEAFAKEVNAEFQGMYKMMSDVMSPSLAKKVQDAIERAERLPDQADAILSDAYNAVIREQSRVKQQLDKKWAALPLEKKKEIAAKQLPEWANVEPKDRAQFIKKAKPILKGDWLEMQHQAEGRTAKLDNPQKNIIKPAWANAAKSIVSELNPIDIPSDMDRRVITEVVNGIREELERRGYTVTNADVQAILWYPEKDLWAKLRGEEESILKQSYDDEFINIAEGLGLGREAREVAKQIRGY